MQVMIDLQLEEMNITFENKTNRKKKNPNVKQKQENSFTLVMFCPPCQEIMTYLRSCDSVCVLV